MLQKGLTRTLKVDSGFSVIILGQSFAFNSCEKLQMLATA